MSPVGNCAMPFNQNQVNKQLISVKLGVVHFFIFWATKTGNKIHSEAHHWWHPDERLRQASCLGGAEMTTSVSGVFMWGSWIIHKHVWCCQLRKTNKWLENVLPVIRDRSHFNMLHVRWLLPPEVWQFFFCFLPCLWVLPFGAGLNTGHWQTTHCAAYFFWGLMRP